MKDMLPGKTVERISLCRRLLLIRLKQKQQYIYSHDIAKLLNVTSVQVRRDLMLMGYTGSPSKGYNIKKLIEAIGKTIDSPKGQNFAIIGVGNLGKAINNYMFERQNRLKLVAVFDIDEKKINNCKYEVKCYHINEIKDIVKKLNISIAIMTVPSEVAQITTDMAVESGIKGIMNYTNIPLDVPKNVYLEEYDILTYLEKVAYFTKTKKR